MKNIIPITLLSIIALMISACGDNNKVLFESKIVEQDNIKTLSVLPVTNFVRFKDSAYFYMSKEDYAAVLSAELLKGETLYKNDGFLIKNMLRSYARTNSVKHEIILRTFKNDMRLLDDIVISSTIDSIPFSGKLYDDLSYEIIYENGQKKTGKINSKGRFINSNDE